MSELRQEIGGHEYVLVAIDDREQVGVEMILGRHLGPSIGAGIAAILSSLAVEAVKAARVIVADPAWDGEASDAPASFDLARLYRVLQVSDSKDEHMERAWDALCKRVPEFVGQMVADSIPELTDRLDHAQIMRLFDLALFGGKDGAPCRLFVVVGGETKKIANWGTLTGFTKANPGTKWGLLMASLLHTYRPLLRKPEEPAASEAA